ncbi:MAG: hypothetical protein IAI49_13995 [Candidatus Eremiobacteraeota bacterium]|nr:hypothetical protein [Candidatus Eremiobacteraeota bacterium]
MAEGPGLETYANHTNSQSASPAEGALTAQAGGDVALKRTLLVVGIAAASAGIAYAIVRVTLGRSPADPTTERIQQLIDEANRLLKQLDDKKPD